MTSVSAEVRSDEAPDPGNVFSLLLQYDSVREVVR
jgi:hypothetical protein